MTTKKRELNAALRQRLAPFIAKTFQTVCPGETYYDAWYIDCVAWHLEQCLNRRFKRLIICLPPRQLKSIITSVAFPAWGLGRDPTLKIICISYAQTLAETFSRQTLAVMQGPWYRETFPKTRPNPRKTSVTEMETTKKGFRLATSIGGTLTGRGGNILIIDDPIKIDEAMSQPELQKVNQWFDNVCRSRLNNKNEDVIIVVTQRANVNDLVGHVTKKEDWKVVNIPAIPDEDQEYQVEDDKFYPRPAGELLCPERESLASLQQQRHVMGSFAFEAQYQQRPQPFEGNLVKRDWLRIRDTLPAMWEFDHVLQSWDTASSDKELASYSVCTTWGVLGEEYHLIDVVRERLEYPDLKRRVIAEARKYGADTVLLECAGSGRHLYQEWRRRGPLRVRLIKPEKDKITRLAAQSAKIEGGQVWIPESAPWLETFLNELLAFPSSEYDDQVDSLSQALLWLGSRRHPQRAGRDPTRPGAFQRGPVRRNPQRQPGKRRPWAA